MKLLLAVDSAESAKLVAASVAARPWPPGTIVRVLTVIDYALIPIELVNEKSGKMKLIRGEMELRAQAIIDRAVEALGQVGLAVEEEIGRRHPRTVIVDTAGDWGADLIYLRSHNDPAVGGRMLGSVAQEVLRSAPCSVGIIRAPADARAGSPARVGMRILLATDGSEYSRAAALSLTERPWPEHSEVKVIGVVDPNVRAIYGELEELPPAGEAEGLPASVDETVESIARSGLKATGELAVGDAKMLIVERAREWAADLIVVGSHGRSGLKRFLLGSVSEFVAHHAHCSTEVIRPHQSADPEPNEKGGQG